MSHEAEIQRGKLAQEVLDNPIYIEAHEAIVQETIRLWREARNPEDREQLHQLLMMHEKAKIALEAVMRSGQVSVAELSRKQSRAEQIGTAYASRWAA